MKSVIEPWLRWVFGCMFTGVSLLAAPRSAEQVSISGKEYVRLNDWARATDAEVRWLKRDETLEVSNHSWRAVLKLDSCEAQIKGVTVWLLSPVASRSGIVYVSKLDVQTTLQPLLSPSKNRPGTGIRTICLDPGHGGRDPGNQVGSNQEKRYTLLLAKEVREQLVRSGLRVILSRTGDDYVERAARPAFAKRNNADLFVSLHFNSADSSRDMVKGAEVYCLTPVGASSTNARGEGADAGWSAGNRNNEKNLLLAFEAQRALTRSLAVEDRGGAAARFEVLRDAVMPAVLIEAGFMSHPVEGRKIFSAEYRRTMAHAIVEGLLNYKKVMER